MPEAFEYVSHARLLYKDGYRHAYLGEVAAPVVYRRVRRPRETARVLWDQRGSSHCIDVRSHCGCRRGLNVWHACRRPGRAQDSF